MQATKINNVATLSLEEIVALPYCAELKPLFYQQKSFHGKAKVFHNAKEHTLELMSYQTIVLKYNYKTKEYRRLWGGWSRTTSQHIEAFCGKYIAKAEWLDLGVGLAFSNDELASPQSLIEARRNLAVA